MVNLQKRNVHSLKVGTSSRCEHKALKSLGFHSEGADRLHLKLSAPVLVQLNANLLF